MTPILSILIPSIPERERSLDLLLLRLRRQKVKLTDDHPSLGGIEVLISTEKKYLFGGPSIGEKRQWLLDQSTGQYVCFLDDDEDIAPDYIESLLRGIYASQPDVVVFKCFVKTDHYWSVVIMDLSHREDEQLRPGFVLRKPWHICPIKSDIAKSERFNALNHGEDVDWLNRIIPKLRSQAYIPGILTQYNHSEKNSEADKIIQHEKGHNS